MQLPDVYMLEGHGCENIIPFEERMILPNHVTVITFADCNRSTFPEDTSWYFRMPTDPEDRQTFINMLSDPTAHVDELKNIFGIDVRVYPPGRAIPNLMLYPYCNFHLPDDRYYYHANEEKGATEEAEIVLLSGIIPLYSEKQTNPKWKDLHDASAIEAGLGDEYGGWCYTTVPKKDEDAANEEGIDLNDPEVQKTIIQPGEIIYEFPHEQFEELTAAGQVQYLPYSEMIYGDDYRIYKETGFVPDHVYDYVYSSSIWKPPRDFDPAEYIWDLKSMIEKLKREDVSLVLYWNVCRVPCDVSEDEEKQKELIQKVRRQSEIQQQRIQEAEGWFAGKRKRRKTHRKNLHKKRKTQKRWTQIRRSRSR